MATKSIANFAGVVLVDDNEVDNMINERLMNSVQFADQVHVFTSGKGALEYFKNLDRNGKFPVEFIPEVIFLDINMPIMNGFLFVDAFGKLSKRITSHTKIVLLTSSENPNDLEKAKKNKLILDLVQKPLDTDKLRTLKRR